MIDIFIVKILKITKHNNLFFLSLKIWKLPEHRCISGLYLEKVQNNIYYWNCKNIDLVFLEVYNYSHSTRINTNCLLGKQFLSFLTILNRKNVVKRVFWFFKWKFKVLLNKNCKTFNVLYLAWKSTNYKIILWTMWWV